MLKTRVIPCLLLKSSGLVKGKKYKNHKYVGDPINTIKIFNAKEVDEIIVLDITATKENKGPNFSLIEKFSSECFMPLCYGGGIKTMQQAGALFSLGVEKVCLQSSAYNDLKLIKEISNKYGNQSVVVSVDIKKNWLKKDSLYNASSGKILRKSYIEFIKECIDAGAGEIMINSVNHEGNMKGMNLDLISKVSALSIIPVIASCGVGEMNDIKLASEAGASAIAVGSFFVYHGPHRAVLITFPTNKELNKLLG
jgi:imidazole glycerol-phosphate synthase subunit HisF